MIPQALDVGERIEHRPEVLHPVFDRLGLGQHRGLDRIEHTMGRRDLLASFGSSPSAGRTSN